MCSLCVTSRLPKSNNENQKTVEQGYQSTNRKLVNLKLASSKTFSLVSPSLDANTVWMLEPCLGTNKSSKWTEFSNPRSRKRDSIWDRESRGNFHFFSPSSATRQALLLELQLCGGSNCTFKYLSLVSRSLWPEELWSKDYGGLLVASYFIRWLLGPRDRPSCRNCRLYSQRTRRGRFGSGGYGSVGGSSQIGGNSRKRSYNVVTIGSSPCQEL